MERPADEEMNHNTTGEAVRPMKRKRASSNCEACRQNDSGVTSSNISHEPPLPPEVWATVMNYLDYDTVLSCAATSKMILRDAMPLVTSLHIDKSCQLNALASRFRDVREINIFSLLVPDQEDDSHISVDKDTSKNSLLFLSRFDKLERVFLGGRYSNGEIIGFNDYNQEYEFKDEQLVTDLIDQISSAFQRNFLHKNLCVLGLRCPDCVSADDDSCSCCLLACKTWPLEHVVNFDYEGSSIKRRDTFECRRKNCLDVCLSREQIERVIKVRPRGRDLLRSDAHLIHLLGQGDLSVIHSDDGTSFYIADFSENVFANMMQAIESAELDTNKLTQKDVTEALMRSFAKDDLGQIPHKNRCYLTPASIITLKDELPLGLNLPIDEDDFLAHLVKDMRNLPQIIKALQRDFIDGSRIKVDCSYLLSQLLDNIDTSEFQHAISLGIIPVLTGIISNNSSTGLISNAVSAIASIAQLGTIADLQHLVESGIIPRLVHFQGTTIKNIGHNSVFALHMFAARSTTWRDIMLREGVVPSLFELLKECTDVCTMQVASDLICELCRGDPKPDLDSVKPCLGQISLLLLLPNRDEYILKSARVALRAFYESNEHAHQAVIDAGVYSRLVELLRHSSQEVQFEALATIKEVFGRSVETDESLLQPFLRNDVLSNLVSLVSEPEYIQHTSTTWIICQLCRVEPKPDFEMLKPCLEPLIQLLSCKREAALSNTCIALKHLCEFYEEACQAILGAKIGTQLVGIVEHSPENYWAPMQHGVLCFVSHLAKRDKSLIQPLVSSEALSSLMPFMKSTNKITQHEASEILCLICEGVLSEGRKEQIHNIVLHGCIQAFCGVLTSSDFDTVECGLDGLRMLIEFGRKECDEVVNHVIRNDISRIREELNKVEERKREGNGLDELARFNQLNEEINRWTSEKGTER